MMKRLSLILLCALGVAAPLQAAPAKKPVEAKAATAETAPAANSAATQTDVIGSKEAPGVFNIVPWKEKATEIPKRAVSTSILRETLQPLDRDVLRREVLLQKSLSAE